MQERSEAISIAALMDTSGVKFGTSGARGLATEMTDRVCYTYTAAFMRYLFESNLIGAGTRVAIAGDFRPSSPRIMQAVAMAIHDAGCQPINCGTIPTPALALYAISNAIPGIMVTGSHIPDDRNGIKFYKPAGEILKSDEEQITALSVEIGDELFDDVGLAIDPFPLPAEDETARQEYIRRYLDFFPADCLAGNRIGIYEHSTVARDILGEVFRGLGAETKSLGRSDTFVPVDTEAIRDEDVELARKWAAEQTFDAIVSADGDGDRPLLSDAAGNWLRGDVAGILTARYLGASCVATPVSCNSAVEKCGWFDKVERTRIGSPFVIAAMDAAAEEGCKGVVGYEANGGFLTASNIELGGRQLPPLPTRDALIVPLAILMLAKEQGLSIARLLASLPQRFTSSGRLKNFPTELSLSRLSALNSGDQSADIAAAEALLGSTFGKVESVDATDGIRVTFVSSEVVHLRPSGNAPELRCYNEAASEERAIEMNQICLATLEGWRH